MSRSTALTQPGELRIDLLWLYDRMMTQAKVQRQKYKSSFDQVNKTTARLVALFPDLADEITRLRLEIRLETRGTPTTEPLASVSSDGQDHELLSEGQYNAQTVLLKSTYRHLAQALHPDRSGGDADLFVQAVSAYDNRDIDELTYIYVNAVRSRNLYWRVSVEGQLFADTARVKPAVRLTQLLSSRGFAIARYYQMGKVAVAKQMTEAYLRERVLELMNELTHMRNQNVQKRKHESQDQGENQGRAGDDQESQESQCG